MIGLTDDGTLDTVLACDGCGQEMRYNWDGEHADDCPETSPDPAVFSVVLCDCYDQFVAWAIADATDAHECQAVGVKG